MMNRRKLSFHVADFETTVYEGQENTEVWCAGIVELNTEDAHIFNNIDSFVKYCLSLDNPCIFLHNLKFDGHFLLDYFLRVKRYKNALDKDGKFLADEDMKNNSIKYSISDVGVWYSITVKHNGHYCVFRDSLKMLPFSVAKIGKDFNTKHQKTSIEYIGERHANGVITAEELDYIKNDLFVVKESIEMLFEQGMTKATIGSNCLATFKDMLGKEQFKLHFPDLQAIEIDESIYGAPNADAYIRKAYKGGWTYCDDRYQGKEVHNGVTLDVNSLYPSMMHSKSGNKYPVGKPIFWRGEIPEMAKAPIFYYFVRFKCRFNIKSDHLPTVQIKRNIFYRGTEWLKTSDVYIKSRGRYFSHLENESGELEAVSVTLTMTMTDFELFQEHYDIYELEILDGCYFISKFGIFDEYIDKFMEQKMNSEGAKRQTAKLYLNNLYGKLSTSPNSSFKVCFVNEDGVLYFKPVKASEKDVVHIACGCAVTSYARAFTIRHAQANYKYFCYADTDSLHMCCNIENVVGCEIDDKRLMCWKHEMSWKTAIFVRQKTYVELDTEDKPHFTCAGLPARGKELLSASMGYSETTAKTDNETEFLKTRRTLTDFDIGLSVPSKLVPKRIKGGVVLTDGYFTMC